MLRSAFHWTVLTHKCKKKKYHGCWLQTHIYLTGDRGAGREVRERAGQLCPPGEFGMCPPWASRGPGVKVNKGAMWTASCNPLTNPFFRPSSCSPVTGIGLFIHWPRPPVAIHTSTATCRLFYILKLHVQTWGQGPLSTVCNSLTLKHSRVAAVYGLWRRCKQRLSMCVKYSQMQTHFPLHAECAPTCTRAIARNSEHALQRIPTAHLRLRFSFFFLLPACGWRLHLASMLTHTQTRVRTETQTPPVMKSRAAFHWNTRVGECREKNLILNWGDGGQRVPVPPIDLEGGKMLYT